MKKIKLSLDYDGHSRGADEEHEYTTEEEREQLITDYIHHNAERIAEMAGVDDFSEVEDTEEYILVSEWQG